MNQGASPARVTGSRRNELSGIIDWRVSMCEKAGVEIRINRFAEKQDVLSENPKIVIIATGGLPNTDILEGADFVHNTWDLFGREHQTCRKGPSL